MPLLQEAQVDAKQDATAVAQNRERIRIKNQRKMYLDRHPEYFTSPDLELSGASNVLKRQEQTNVHQIPCSMIAASEDSNLLLREKQMGVLKAFLGSWKLISIAPKQSTLRYVDSISMASQWRRHQQKNPYHS